MIFALYRALWWILLPAITLFRFYKDWRSPLFRAGGFKRFLQRLAFTQYRSVDVVLHAVSLGEMRAATPIVEALLEQYPHLKILLTSTTLTGFEQGEKSFGDRVMHRYLPLDNGWMIARFLKKTAPRLMLIMETELWPNLLYRAGKRKIPLFIVSACLSERSYQGYRKFSHTFTPLLKELEVLAQSEEDAERFINLGVKRARVMGNIKYNLQAPKEIEARANQLKVGKGERLLWVVASTHEGEEALILDSFTTLAQDNLILAIAPRHPERFESVATLIESREIPYQRRTKERLEQFKGDYPIWLFDSLGELLLLYSAADLVTVGGSFVPIGGHNILEPALFAKPIIVGPHMEENREILHHFLNYEGLLVAESEEALLPILERLIKDEAEREALGARAYEAFEAKQQALPTLMEAIAPYLE